MTPNAMGASWLRGRAGDLRRAAAAAHTAYPTQPKWRAACEKVEAGYREAADLLDRRATELEEADAVSS